MAAPSPWAIPSAARAVGFWSRSSTNCAAGNFASAWPPCASGWGRGSRWWWRTWADPAAAARSPALIPTMKEIERMPNVDQIAHEYKDRVSELDPNEATTRGSLGHDSEMTDYSPAGHEARAALARKTLGEVEQVGLGSDRDRLAASVMRDRLQVEVDFHDSGNWMRSLSPFGPMVTARRVFDLMARADDHDWEVIAERLSGVPGCVGGMRETLDLGASRNVVSARRQAAITAAQARAWSGAESERGTFAEIASEYEGSSETL